MYIAFDFQIFLLQTYGGISRYFIKLAENLIALSQDITILAPLHRNHLLAEASNLSIRGFALSDFPPKAYKLIHLYNYLVTKYCPQKQKPDIVHETYYSFRKTAIGSCPTIVTVHDMIYELFPLQYPKNDFTSKQKKIAVDRATHVICDSEHTKKDLVNIFCTPEDKISVVYLGIDTVVGNSNKLPRESSTQKPYLLYVGNRGGYKNFNGFINGVAQSKRLIKDFDIIAFGGGHFSADELLHFSHLGFSENQIKHFSGNDSILHALYQHAYAFIFPSFYEGFGMPPLEAMAHNCPIICSNSSSIPEVVGDAGEYFDPSSVDDISMTIENVVYNNETREKLLSYGKKRILHFSWKKCAEKTLSVYQQILNS